MDDDHQEFFDFFFWREAFKELENRWQKGKLDQRVQALEKFILQHLDQIRESIGHEEQTVKITEAVKEVFISIGTMDSIADMQDQIEEMRNEIWIQGEQGQTDQRAVQAYWTKNYARLWRQWRNLEYLYVIEKGAPELYKQLA